MSAQPFSTRSALALVVVGAAAFVALLYAIGAGLTGGGNDGGSHALGRGLNGYSALAALLAKVDIPSTVVRDPGRLDDSGLLILTPPQGAKGEDIERVVSARRGIGPTLVITPKWLTAPAGSEGRSGWTRLVGSAAPEWQGFADDVALDIASAREWRLGNTGGRLPSPRRVESGTGKNLVPLVTSETGRILAAFRRDEGFYPRLNHLAGVAVDRGGDDMEIYPVTFVFEPDLLDNQGLANRATALLALRLIREASDGGRLPVMFDVTLNGLGRGRNLLTLAFAPPFLAATLALLMAALVAGWRSFARFGPARLRPRAVAHGKATLVANSAGLIRRAGRIRLLGAPYAALVIQRLERALGLPANSEASALPAALARRGGDATAFTQAAVGLREARKPHQLIRAASALHAIEKDLSR